MPLNTLLFIGVTSVVLGELVEALCESVEGERNGIGDNTHDSNKDTELRQREDRSNTQDTGHRPQLRLP